MSKKFHEKFICSRMMLPEHAAALYADKVKEEKKELLYIPEHEEQQLEEWEKLITSSLSAGTVVEIKYTSSKKIMTVKGFVFKVNLSEKLVHIRSQSTKTAVHFNNILEINES